MGNTERKNTIATVLFVLSGIFALLGFIYSKDGSSFRVWYWFNSGLFLIACIFFGIAMLIISQKEEEK